MARARKKGISRRDFVKAFTLSMHEFIYALTFISVSAKKTVSIGVPTELVRGDVFQWGPLMAGALLASIPVAVVYTFSWTGLLPASPWGQ
jgi:ABC-type glycerol-3-phosphate transport system permease component